MTNAIGNWLRSTAVLVAALVLAVMVCSQAGCNKPQAGDTYEQRSASADQRAAAVTEIMQKLGIEGDAMVSFGPGYYGMFNGAIVDTGLRVQAVLRVSPERAQLLAKALKAYSEGKTVDEAVAEAKAGLPEKTATKEVSHEEVDTPPANAGGG